MERSRLHGEMTKLAKGGGHSPTFSNSSEPDNFQKLRTMAYRSNTFTAQQLASEFPDSTYEEDLLINCHEFPANPANTPTSQNPRHENDEDNNRLPLASGHLSVNCMTAILVSKNNQPTCDHCKTLKPPRPPKPAHLSTTNFCFTSMSENIRPVTKTKSLDVWKDKDILEDRYRSLPAYSSRASLEFIDQVIDQPALEYPATPPAKTCGNGNIVPWRYLPRPLPSQNFEPLRIPLIDQGVPFPAPIPTVDKLPLHRGLIGASNCDGADPRARPTEEVFPGPFKKPIGTRKILKDAARNLMQILPFRAHMKSTIVDRRPCEVFWEQYLPLESPLRISVGIGSSGSKCIEYSGILGDASPTTSNPSTSYVFRINLAIPVLCLHGIAMVCTAIRLCLSPRATTRVVSWLWAFVVIPALLVLKIFNIEAATETERE